MATPDFILTAEYIYVIDSHDSYTLPKGTFVRPIKLSYVPKHILEKKVRTEFDKKLDVYCYTSYGILPIPKKSIIQVGGSAFLDINSYT